jgi:hypothetical protein
MPKGSERTQRRKSQEEKEAAGLAYPDASQNPAVKPSHRRRNDPGYRKGPHCPECGTPFSHINKMEPDEDSPGVQRLRACANGHQFQTGEFVVDSIKTLREWTKHASPTARGVVTKVLTGVIESPPAVRVRAAESILERQERYDFIEEAKGHRARSIEDQARAALADVLEPEVRVISDTVIGSSAEDREVVAEQSGAGETERPGPTPIRPEPEPLGDTH